MVVWCMNKWFEQAACAGMELDSFYESYYGEEAIFVDKVCMSCPVIRQCYTTGINTESWGTWGGVYMEDGYIIKSRNEHKTRTVWNDVLFLLTND